MKKMMFSLMLFILSTGAVFSYSPYPSANCLMELTCLHENEYQSCYLEDSKNSSIWVMLEHPANFTRGVYVMSGATWNFAEGAVCTYTPYYRPPDPTPPLKVFTFFDSSHKLTPHYNDKYAPVSQWEKIDNGHAVCLDVPGIYFCPFDSK